MQVTSHTAHLLVPRQLLVVVSLFRSTGQENTEGEVFYSVVFVPEGVEKPGNLGLT